VNEINLAQVANEHWRWFYRGLVGALGGEWRRFGSVDAFSTPHVPAPFANGLLVIEPAAASDVVEAINWVIQSAAPFRARIDTSLGDELLEAPIKAGLEREEWTMPGMVLMPIPAAAEPASGVTTERVVESNYDDFIQATVECGMPREIALGAFDLSATASGQVDFFLGRLNGRPAATATLVRTESVAGIYSVSTVDDARRRGLGTAVTWAAVARAKEWGVDAVVLQSSEMGLGVYNAMGFRTVVEYAGYAPRE